MKLTFHHAKLYVEKAEKRLQKSIIMSAAISHTMQDV